MSGDEGEGMTLPEIDAQLVRRLFDHARMAEDGEMSFADARKAAQTLFAQIAMAKMNPAAIPIVVEDGKHPMFARQFAAVNATFSSQSWPVQEQRVLKRYAKAKDRLRDAEVLVEAAQAKRAEAEAELEEVSIDMALMRLNLMLRGMQEFVRPALNSGPLLALALAVLGDPASDDDDASEAKRADARRTLDVLARRIEDDVFLAKVGEMIRDFVTTYDDEVGAERRLTSGAAERSRDSLLADGKAVRKLREIAAGVAGAVSDEAGKMAGEAASSEGREDEDEFEGLPF